MDKLGLNRVEGARTHVLDRVGLDGISGAIAVPLTGYENKSPGSILAGSVPDAVVKLARSEFSLPYLTQPGPAADISIDKVTMLACWGKTDSTLFTYKRAR